VKLLHKNPVHRFKNLSVLREELAKLKENILQTPTILRQIIGHPILPNEDFGQTNIPKLINFKNSKMNEFSLKYLAKFVFEHKVERLAINGGFMPLHYIKTNQLTQLLLKDAQLHSEDLFILSQYLKHNNSITHIDLSKNKIGLKYVEESKVIEYKMKNQDKLKDFSFQ
jgi:hypothetical protein